MECRSRNIERKLRSVRHNNHGPIAAVYYRVGDGVLVKTVGPGGSCSLALQFALLVAEALRDESLHGPHEGCAAPAAVK